MLAQPATLRSRTAACRRINLWHREPQVARCTKIISPNTDDAKYVINIKQIAKFVVGLGDKVGAVGGGWGSVAERVAAALAEGYRLLLCSRRPCSGLITWGGLWWRVLTPLLLRVWDPRCLAPPCPVDPGRPHRHRGGDAGGGGPPEVPDTDPAAPQDRRQRDNDDR